MYTSQTFVRGHRIRFPSPEQQHWWSEEDPERPLPEDHSNFLSLSHIEEEVVVITPLHQSPRLTHLVGFGIVGDGPPQSDYLQT